MKLKKLIKVIRPKQAIKLVSTTGRVTNRSSILRLDDKNFEPLFQALKECKVQSIRSLCDPLHLPDYQEYLEITLIGGHDND